MTGPAVIGAAAPVQLDRWLLADEDFWEWTCPCGLVTQGGRPGLAAHQATVHREPGMSTQTGVR